jgi:uncharacterized protein YbjT (DUF2867 family)
MMDKKPLLLTGANGRTGRAILQAMVRHGIPVRAFIRKPEQAADLRALGAAEIAVGDMADPASIDAAVEGAGTILHIGPPMHPDEREITARFIAAAKTNGLAHFIYYSVMHPLRREVRHHRLKLDAEEALIESGLSYTIVQPSRYMQHLVPIWPRVMQDGVHAMPFNVHGKYNIVDLDDLAEACAMVAANPAKHQYATYELAGPEALSQTDMAAIISDVIARPVRAEAIPLDVVAQKARAAGADDDRVEQMLIMNRHYDAHGFRGNPNILEYLLGRPATRFRAYVARLANG